MRNPLMKILNNRRRMRETGYSWANYTDPEARQIAATAFAAGAAWMAEEAKKELAKVTTKQNKSNP